MQLDKAIENLQSALMRPGSVDKLDLQDAQQLGIEALVKIKKGRATFDPYYATLLPSETTE